MDALNSLAAGLSAALLPGTLLATAAGALLGTLVGILPGLGSPAAVALLLPLSFAMEPVAALALLAGVWYGSSYGGIVTAVLLNIPGEGDSVIATLDGYEMARQGRGGVALGISAVGGFVAGTIALLLLMYLGPSAARLSLAFGPPDFFALMFMGLSLIVWLSAGGLARGLLSAGLGLLLGIVGIDLMSGEARLTFGSVQLLSGVGFVPVVIGLFGLSEVLSNVGQSQPGGTVRTISLGWRDLLPESRAERRRSVLSILRGSGAGFLIGLIPGAGPTVSTFVAYAVEKKLAREPARFGKGAIEGVAAPEAANNAATVAGMIPLLSLGLPASSTAAVLLGGFLVHGLVPGPLLFRDHPDVVWALIGSLYVGNVILLVLNTALIPLLIRLLAALRGVLPAVVVVLVILGAYSLRSSIFDIGIALTFGLVGYVFKRSGIPLPPLVIALILGPKAEVAMRQSLTLSDNDFSVFVTSPWAGAMMAVSLLVLAQPLVGAARRRLAGRRGVLRADRSVTPR